MKQLKHSKILLSSYGFTLTELAIAVALLSVITLGTAQIFSQSFELINRVQTKQAFLSLQTDLRMLVSTPRTCRASIGADQEATTQKFAARAMDRAYTGGALNRDGGLDFRMNFTPDESMQANRNLTGYPFRVDSLKVYDAQVVGSDMLGNAIYHANIIGTFTPTKRGALDLPAQNMASLFLRVTGANDIIDCFSVDTEDPASLDAYNQMQCERAAGTYDPQTARCDLMPGVCYRLGGTLTNDGRCTGVAIATAAAAAPAPPPPRPTSFRPEWGVPGGLGMY